MADRDHVRERAFGALAAVVALALGVGVVLAVGAYAAARMVGLTGDGGHHPTARPVAAASRAPSPTTHASHTPSPAPSPSSTKHQADTANRPAHDQQTRHPRRKQVRADQQQHRHSHARRHQHHRRHRHRQAGGTVTLRASASQVRPMARVDLDGRCGCRSGTTLVVQRLEHGHWSRFPSTATASGGRFHTWVMTGRQGANTFRVAVPGGNASNPVTITVR